MVVMGRKEPITTYELLVMKGEETSVLLDFIERYDKALNLFRTQKWDESRKIFEKLEKEEDMFPGRKTNPSRVYMDRCDAYKKDPPSRDWDGVTVLTKK